MIEIGLTEWATADKEQKYQIAYWEIKISEEDFKLRQFLHDQLYAQMVGWA